MAAKLISKIRLPAQASMLKGMRQDVRAAIENVCSDAEHIDHLVIAINEASMNVIQHAYKESNHGDIVLEIYKDNDQLIFNVIDFAKPIDLSKVKPREVNEIIPGGLGLHIIQEVMDEMTFIDNPDGAGNILEMKVSLYPDMEKS